MILKSKRKIISNLNLDPPKQSVKGEKRIKTFSDIQDLKKNIQTTATKNYLPYTFSQKLWKDVLPQNKAVNQERERHRTQPKKKKKSPTQERGKEKSSSKQGKGSHKPTENTLIMDWWSESHCQNPLSGHRLAQSATALPCA